MPGLSVHSVEWMHRHDVAGAFTDSYTYEVVPAQPCPTGRTASPCTCSTLRDMGLIQGQNWDFEELSVDVRRRRRSGTFLLCAAPEPLVGASSAPVAPVAVL